MSKHLIILTCTVKTKMTEGMNRSDSEVRLNDYISAITKWSNLSKELGFGILVAENSNSIEDLRRDLLLLNNPNLKFVQLKEDIRSHLQGNSAGEYQMLKEIVELGIIPREIGVIWKITGRLFVRNFNQILPTDSPDLIVNRFYNPKHIVDTRIIGFSQNKFDTLFSSNPIFISENNVIPSGDQETYSSLEHLVTLNVLQSEFRGEIVKSMNKVPIFIGHSGTTNKEIDGKGSRFKKQVANYIRPMILKLLVGSTP